MRTMKTLSILTILILLSAGIGATSAQQHVTTTQTTQEDINPWIPRPITPGIQSIFDVQVCRLVGNKVKNCGDGTFKKSDTIAAVVTYKNVGFRSINIVWEVDPAIITGKYSGIYIVDFQGQIISSPVKINKSGKYSVMVGCCMAFKYKSFDIR
jgi:hypothetical protein